MAAARMQTVRETAVSTSLKQIPSLRPMVWRFVLLFLGVFACSTSALFIKASHTDPMVLTAVRLTVAVVFLAPLYLRERKRHEQAIKTLPLRRTWLPAIVLALHLASWSFAARMTAVAQSTLIVNLVPVAMPFFLYWAAKERINRAEIVGTVLAVAGLIILTGKDAAQGGANLWGNIVCIVSMLLFAAYLALGRKNRDFPSVWLYVIPVYSQAALVCLVLSLPWIRSFEYGSIREWAIMAGLALVPTITGHSLLNTSMRYFRGQIVSLCNVAQFVFAGVMAFMLFREIPSGVYYAVSALVVAGVATVVLAAPAEAIPADEAA